MTNRQRLQFLSFLFSIYLCHDVGIDGNFVPSDFLQLARNSFKQLQAAGVKNMVYFLVRSVGALRSDGSGPRMPLDQMPFGLIHHNLEFLLTITAPIYTLLTTMLSGKQLCSPTLVKSGTSFSVARCGVTMVRRLMRMKCHLLVTQQQPRYRRQRYLWLANTCFHKQQHSYYRRQKSMWPVKTCLRKQQARGTGGRGPYAQISGH